MFSLISIYRSLVYQDAGVFSLITLVFRPGLRVFTAGGRAQNSGHTGNQPIPEPPKGSPRDPHNGPKAMYEQGGGRSYKDFGPPGAERRFEILVV